MIQFILMTVSTYFKSQPVFCALGTWFRSVLALALENDFLVGFMAIISVLGVEAAGIWITDDTFGTKRIVIFLVLATVFINTAYGVKKSMLQRKILFSKALKFPYNSPKYNNLLVRSERHKFSWSKLQFVFFKCFTLLGYLYFVTNLLEGSGSFFDFSAEVLAKAPIAIFWYYEFKSIGDNGEYIYEKKASIFKIVEMIFEPRILKFFGEKTPTDGVHNKFEENEEDEQPK